jgi:transcriptional regulator with PAS, ATPase and Fis domain
MCDNLVNLSLFSVGYKNCILSEIPLNSFNESTCAVAVFLILCESSVRFVATLEPQDGNMKISRHGWVHRLLVDLGRKAHVAQQDLVRLEQALNNAYEGIVITDAEGIILKVNQAYADFLGKDISTMVGRHVTDVVENTRMHIVARTGKAELAEIQKINGHEMICSRIPVFDKGRIVAVVGKVIFQNVDDLFIMTDRFRSLKKELEFYKNELNRRLVAKYSFANIFGKSQELEQVKQLGKKVAATDSTILIRGESGTGKELFAHSIHMESHRALGPFVKVNCAAIPETLFESELFGYKEGSFTGANKKGKKGKFMLANKGTIFLDEITELPLLMQVKLLRVLQEKEVEPVGSDRPEHVDVRIIAACNKPLEPLVKQGLFRHDLFYRLNVVKLEIPPLRERVGDVPVLIEKLLRQLEKETGIPVEGVDQDVEAILSEYSWPGNVRELRNVLEQALYVKNCTIITRQDIPRSLAAGRSEKDVAEEVHTLKYLLRQTEEDVLRRALREEKGNKSAIAARLGISKSSLYAKIEYFGIQT